MELGEATTWKHNNRGNNDNYNILKTLNLFPSITYIKFSVKGGMLTHMLTLDLLKG